jgi:hypothetical protein
MNVLLPGKNLRNPEKLALKQANVAYVDCITKNFLGQWLDGASITVNDVCQEEFTKMQELDGENYPPLPFKLDT